MDYARIETSARAARDGGAEVVLVLGLGFVGTAVAGNLARAEKNGARLFFVIGLDRHDDAGLAKVARLDQGSSPTYANDPSLERVIHEACVASKNLVGTTDPRAIGLADIVVSCINLDVQREMRRDIKRLLRVSGRFDEAELDELVRQVVEVARRRLA